MNPSELLAMSREASYDRLDDLVDVDPIELRDVAWRLLEALRHARQERD